MGKFKHWDVLNKKIQIRVTDEQFQRFKQSGCSKWAREQLFNTKLQKNYVDCGLVDKKELIYVFKTFYTHLPDRKKTLLLQDPRIVKVGEILGSDE